MGPMTDRALDEKSCRVRYWGLIPAAGTGERFGGTRPKQYQHVTGVPLLQFSLNCLAKAPEIAGITVGLASTDRWFESMCQAPAKLISTFIGGSSRAETVLRGLELLCEHGRDEDWVLVHDAVRPCLKLSDVSSLINAVGDGTTGGILAVPVRDTLKNSDAHGYAIKTLEREGIWRALTPQMFRLRDLITALQACSSTLSEISDEASAIEQAGQPVKLVAGREDNIKVTVAEDLDLVSAILANGCS